MSPGPMSVGQQQQQQPGMYGAGGNNGGNPSGGMGQHGGGMQQPATPAPMTLGAHHVRDGQIPLVPSTASDLFSSSLRPLARCRTHGGAYIHPSFFAIDVLFLPPSLPPSLQTQKQEECCLVHSTGYMNVFCNTAVTFILPNSPACSKIGLGGGGRRVSSQRVFNLAATRAQNWDGKAVLGRTKFHRAHSASRSFSRN